MPNPENENRFYVYTRLEKEHKEINVIRRIRIRILIRIKKSIEIRCY